MKRKFVKVTWRDAGDIDNKTYVEGMRSKAPVKITYGWLFSIDKEVVRICGEEGLPDGENWEHMFDLTLIPTSLVLRIIEVGK